MTDDIKAKITKYYYDIKICGMGVIVLSLWSVFKFWFALYLGGQNIFEYVGIEYEDFDDFELALVTFFVFLIMIIILFIECMVGFSAIKYAAGKKKRKGFFIIVAAMGIFSLCSIRTYFIGDNKMDIYTKIASIMIDFTFMYICFDMIYAAIRAGILKRNYKKV